jgi:S1-C subfamily serine protease
MRHHSIIVATLGLLACAASLRADEFAEKARDIFTKNEYAVVTVELVQKVSASGRAAAREAKADLTGTVLDPSGLTVIALSSADPFELIRRMSEDYKGEVEISEVKMLLQDGTEVPAGIVLRDNDLDLAFIRPKTKPATPMAAIDVGKAGPAQVLDQVLAINRLNRAAGRAFSASEERIAAVVQKPRTFYIPDSGVSETGMGSPAFTMNGAVLGIFVMRAVNAQGASSGRDCMTAIILPAEDVMKAAAQAPTEVKPDEAPKDTAAPAATNAPAVAPPSK